MRRILLADAARRIAAQRHDMAHAGGAIIADHLVHFLARGGDAGQMRRRRQRRLVQDALDGGMGALAGGAAGAIGHRDEIRAQRRKPRHRLPQRLLHLLRLGRKEFERDADAALAAGVGDAAGARVCRRSSRHLARWREHDARIARRARATRRSCRRSPAPAAECDADHVEARRLPAIASPSRGAKPSRRCACSSRRNSRSCGAKSTTSSRPPGRSTRAASRIARAPSSRKCST